MTKIKIYSLLSVSLLSDLEETRTLRMKYRIRSATKLECLEIE